MASEAPAPAPGAEHVKVLGININRKKAVETVKGAALAYVGFKLGVATLKFIGKSNSGQLITHKISTTVDRASVCVYMINGGRLHMTCPCISRASPAGCVWPNIRAAVRSSACGGSPLLLCLLAPPRSHAAITRSCRAPSWRRQAQSTAGCTRSAGDRARVASVRGVSTACLASARRCRNPHRPHGQAHGCRRALLLDSACSPRFFVCTHSCRRYPATHPIPAHHHRRQPAGPLPSPPYPNIQRHRRAAVLPPPPLPRSTPSRARIRGTWWTPRRPPYPRATRLWPMPYCRARHRSCTTY